jgi:hypothetical protein
MDLKSYSRWYDYSRARDAMFAATDTAWAPWYVARTDDKQRGRLNLITHLLSQVPYKPLTHNDVTLPKRQRAGGYVEPDLPLRMSQSPWNFGGGPTGDQAASSLVGVRSVAIVWSSATRSAGRWRNPLTRRNCLAASPMPAAVQRSTIWPSCQRLTLAA